jgi:hypothetical protein
MDIKRVKYNLGRQVIFDGKSYTLTACIMRQGENGFRFQAELKDNAADSSLVIADLKNVTEKETES